MFHQSFDSFLDESFRSSLTSFCAILFLQHARAPVSFFPPTHTPFFCCIRCVEKEKNLLCRRPCQQSYCCGGGITGEERGARCIHRMDTTGPETSVLLSKQKTENRKTKPRTKFSKVPAHRDRHVRLQLGANEQDSLNILES